MAVRINVKDAMSGKTRKIKCTPVFGGSIVIKSDQMPTASEPVTSSCLSGLIFTEGGKLVSAKVVNMHCSLHDGAITVDDNWDPGQYKWAFAGKNQAVGIERNADREWVVIALK